MRLHLHHTWVCVTWVHLMVGLGQVLPQCKASRPIVLGAIFESRGVEMHRTLQFAVNYINQRQMLGPDMHLTYVINTTSQVTDAFDVFQIACGQAAAGVVGYIGPLTSRMVSLVAPLAGSMHLPIIAPFATSPLLARPTLYPYVVRLSAPDSLQGVALVDLVEHFGWKRMTILTSDTDYGVHGLRSFTTEAAHRGWAIVSVQLFQVTTSISDIDVSRQLSLIRDLGVRVVVLHCLAVFGLRVLEQAASFDMTSSGWAWVVTDGLTTVAVSRRGALHLVGAVGTRPTTDRGQMYDDMMALWRMYAMTSRPLSSLQARLIDAVLTFTLALHDLPTQWRTNLTTPRVDCLSGRGWEGGPALLENILQVDANGVAGRLRFTPDQSPAEVVYDYVNMRTTGWVKVGEWTRPGQGVVSSRVMLAGGRRTVSDMASRLRGHSLRVVVIDEPPFIILLDRNKGDNRSGTLHRDQVTGYCLDLLDKLAEGIGFTYRLYLVPDGKFGVKNHVSGKWNGLMKELVERTADMAAAPLTITNVRVRDVDFTKPYFDQGIGILMQSLPPEPWDPFKFTRPFTGELWYYILGTTLVMGVYLSLLNRLSPYDLHGRFIYIQQDEQLHAALRNIHRYRDFSRNKMAATTLLNLGNSMWLSIASLLHQGAEQYPRALSSRLSLLMWWLGIVIIIATYTANLAAHLTSTHTLGDIASIEDLATQNRVMYGTVVDSSVLQFLSDSEVPLHTDMVDFMKKRGTIVSNSSHGIDRTRGGNYAFLWDTAVLDYSIEQAPCESLRTVGRTFGKSGYGFGLQKNSPYNAELSQYILTLRENGFLEKLRDKWYVENTQCHRMEKDKPGGGTRLGTGHMIDITSGYIFRKLGFIDKIQGVFLIVWIGCGAGFLVLVVEWVVACSASIDQRNPKKPQTLAEAFRLRWRGVCKDLWVTFSSRCCTQHPDQEEVYKDPPVPYSRPQMVNTSGIRPTLCPEPPARCQLVRRVGLGRHSLSQLGSLTSRQLADIRAVRRMGSHVGSQAEWDGRSHGGSHNGLDILREIRREGGEPHTGQDCVSLSGSYSSGHSYGHERSHIRRSHDSGVEGTHANRDMRTQYGKDTGLHHVRSQGGMAMRSQRVNGGTSRNDPQSHYDCYTGRITRSKSRLYEALCHESPSGFENWSFHPDGNPPVPGITLYEPYPV